MSRRDEGRASPVRLFLLFTLALVAGAFVWLRWFQAPPTLEPTLPWDDTARREVQSYVERRFVEKLSDERSQVLFDQAMKGYVERLDPFSRYVTAAERAALDEDTTGTFGGIGVRVDPVPAGLLVVAVRRGGPAEAAGILPGETIEIAGGEPLTGRDREQMIDLIKGREGTEVEVAVRPVAGGDLRKALVRRAQVDLDTVPAVRTFDGPEPVGYVRLAQFSDTTAAQARDAVAQTVARGARGIVLDLRHNLGGVVQAAVDVASIFVPHGTLVCTSHTRDRAHEYRTAAEGPAPIALPLVVLVDEMSASASEILAGALQDHGRAVLVGERTYGKYVMQTIVPLANRGAMLRLTTARYESPRGRSCQKDARPGALGGLEPDVRVPVVSRDEEDAIRIEFARQAGPAWNVMQGRDGSADPPDRQLGVALDLLRGGSPPAEPVAPRAN